MKSSHPWPSISDGWISIPQWLNNLHIMWIVAVWDDENWSKWAKHGWNQPKNEHQVKRRWRERIIRFWARNLWFFLLQQTTNALGITHNGEHNYSEVEDNQKLRSVPRLGLRFFSLRTTSLIYGYSLTRKIYWWIWTWFEEACTCVLEMIIRTLSLNHMLTHAFHAE